MKIFKILCLFILFMCTYILANEFNPRDNLLIGPPDVKEKIDISNYKKASFKLLKEIRHVIINTSFPSQAIKCDGSSLNMKNEKYIEFQDFVWDEKLYLLQSRPDIEYIDSFVITELPDFYIFENEGKRFFCVPKKYIEFQEYKEKFKQKRKEQ